MEPLKSNLSSLEKRPAECPAHGPYNSLGYQVDGEQRWSPCSDCEREAQLSRIRREAQEMESVKRAERFATSGIPPRFISAALDNYQAFIPGQEQALEVCLSYCADFEAVRRDGRCLIFLGGVGTGKTHLAVSIMREVIACGWSAKMATIADYFRECKAAWGKRAEQSEIEVLESYFAPDLLVLDEIGVQFGSKTELDLLFGLINKRYNHNKPNMAIANLEKEPLKEYLGKATYDRFRGGGSKILSFNWESYRGRSAA